MVGGFAETERQRALTRLRQLTGGEGDNGLPSALKEAREGAHLSQRRLAVLAGVDQSRISRIEAAEAALLPETSAKLAAALKTDANQLLLREGVRHLGRLAAEGRLSPHVPASMAVYMLESGAPPSPAAAAFGNEILERLMELAELSEASYLGEPDVPVAAKAARLASGRRRRGPSSTRSSASRSSFRTSMPSASESVGKSRRSRITFELWSPPRTTASNSWATSWLGNRNSLGG